MRVYACNALVGPFVNPFVHISAFKYAFIKTKALIENAARPIIKTLPICQPSVLGFHWSNKIALPIYEFVNVICIRLGQKASLLMVELPLVLR